jgi:hypothetical protein
LGGKKLGGKKLGRMKSIEENARVSVTFHEHSMIQGCGTLPFVGNRRVVERQGLGGTRTEIRHIDGVGVLNGNGIPPDYLKASWTLTSFS